MFKRKATDRDTQPTTTQWRRTVALKIARLLPDGCCCCLSDKGNEILFRIFSPPVTTIAGLDGCGPMAWPSTSPDLTPMDFFLYGHIKVLIFTLPVYSKEDLIASIFEGSNLAYLSAYVGLCCVVFGCVSRSVYFWTSTLNWYEIQLFVKILKWFCLISNLSQTQFDGP